jgi:hypothetical protein
VTHSSYFVIDLLNLAYVAMAIAIAAYADRLFKSRPIGLWGDIAVAVVGVAAFAVFLKNGYDRALLELNDWYPAYFSLAYAPVVAFVSIGFVRSIAPFFPAPAGQPAMAMAAGGTVTPPPPSMLGGSSAAAIDPVPEPAASAAIATGPVAKPESKLKKRLTQVFWIGLTILIALVGLARFVARNDLPGCGSQPTKEVIAKIYQPLKVEFKRYDKVETKSTADDVITCAASVTLMNDRHADLEYEITRQEGGNFSVKITAARDQ